MGWRGGGSWGLQRAMYTHLRHASTGLGVPMPFVGSGRQMVVCMAFLKPRHSALAGRTPHNLLALGNEIVRKLPGTLHSIDSSAPLPCSGFARSCRGVSLWVSRQNKKGHRQRGRTPTERQILRAKASPVPCARWQTVWATPDEGFGSGLGGNGRTTGDGAGDGAGVGPGGKSNAEGPWGEYSASAHSTHRSVHPQN